MAKKASRRTALVYCQGGTRAKRKIGDSFPAGDCVKAKADFPEGVFECARGCLGLGTCVAVCRPGAISINALGVAEVDAGKCVGCGLCAKRCPQGIIGMVFRENVIMPRCSNTDKGNAAKDMCAVSCVACRICERNCPSDAVAVIDNRAVVDEDRCISCGMCAVKCPRGVIVDSDGIITRA